MHGQFIFAHEMTFSFAVIFHCLLLPDILDVGFGPVIWKRLEANHFGAFDNLLLIDVSACPNVIQEGFRVQVAS
jgi:hypothetical protein